VVHFGMRDNQILDAVYKELKIPVAQLLTNEKYKYIKKSTIPSLTGRSYTLQSYQQDIFSGLFELVDWSLDKQRVTLKDKEYIVTKVVPLNNFLQEAQGYIFVAIDITHWVETRYNNLTKILIAGFAAILLSFLIMYFGYGLLAPQIIDLQVVEKVNVELKDRVAERTRELVKSEKYFKAIFNAPSEAIYVLDGETGVILDVNQATLDLFGVSYDEALALTISEMSQGEHPYTLEGAQQKMHLAVNEGPQIFEWRCRKKNGDLFWVEIGLKTTQLEGRSYIIAVVREIDSRKQLEEQLLLFKTFVETSNQGMGWVDTKGKIIYINPAIAELFGEEDPEAAIGKNVATTYYSETEQKRVIEDIFPQVAEKGYWSGDIVLQQIGGKQIPTYNSLFVVRDDAGEPLFFANIVTDITERQKATDAMKKLHRELEEKVRERTFEYKQAKENADFANKAKSEFLANMSHEIRTPLNSLLGFIDILKDNLQDKENQDYLKIIDTSSRHLLGIINDILDFSKIESGKLELDTIDFNAKEEFLSVVELFFNNAQESGILIKLSIDDNLPKTTLGDMVRVKQVLSNLLSNAIKFTKKYKNIEVIINYQDGFLNILVKDEGKGIAKNKLKYIFKSFSQEDTSTTREYGGTGLGLAISSELVRLLAGKLKVKSELGVGSEFYFTITLNICNDKFELNEENKIEIKSFPNAKILVAEDNPTNQMVTYLSYFRNLP